jgi:hypothetical protein
MTARAHEPWFEATMEAFGREAETDEDFGRKMSACLPRYFVDRGDLDTRAGLTAGTGPSTPRPPLLAGAEATWMMAGVDSMAPTMEV